MEKRKARNLAKKWLRKRIKGLQAIESIENRNATELVQDSASPNLLIVHGTQSEPEEYHTLMNKLQEFGELKAFVMVPGVPYCFASFSCVESAVEATNALNHGNVEIEFATKPQGLNLFYTGLSLDSLQLQANSKTQTDKLVPGLTLESEFISPEQEQLITTELDSQTWTKLTKRRVQHYGFVFKYGANSFDEPHQPMPYWASEILVRLEERFGMEFDQLTVNDYSPGDSIPPHIDSHSPFEETLVSISLLSPISINYRLELDEVNVYVPPRSLLVMQGESRYVWKHSIQQRKFEVYNGFTVYRTRRISLTFRKTRSGPCMCPYPHTCDTLRTLDLELKARHDQVSFKDIDTSVEIQEEQDSTLP